MTVHDVHFLLWQECVHDQAFWEKRHFIFLDYECQTEMEEATLSDEAQEYRRVPVEKAQEFPSDEYTKRSIEKHIEPRTHTQ